MTIPLTTTGRLCLRAIAQGRPPADDETRDYYLVLCGAGLAREESGLYTITDEGAETLRAHDAARAQGVKP